MKTPQQIKNEVEKGCAIDFDKDILKTKTAKDIQNKILTEYDKSIKEKLRYLLNTNEYVCCKYCGTIAYGNGECHCKKSFKTDGNWIIDINLLEDELLSKIGDNSEVEK